MNDIKAGELPIIDSLNVANKDKGLVAHLYDTQKDRMSIFDGLIEIQSLLAPDLPSNFSLTDRKVQEDLCFYRMIVIQNQEGKSLCCGTVFIGNQNKKNSNESDLIPFETFGLICNIMIEPEVFKDEE